MNTNPLADVTPVFFLQTFILELMHPSEQHGQKHCEQLIEHIAKTAGCFFEETYPGQAMSALRQQLESGFLLGKSVRLRKIH
jgi:hypothetical protein